MKNYPLDAENEILQEQPYNAGDQEHVSKARKSYGRKARKKLEYVRTIMSTSDGREWMYTLLNDCKVFASPIVAGDPYFTYHNIGEQNIGKKILQEINIAAPHEYVVMMEEAREKKL